MNDQYAPEASSPFRLVEDFRVTCEELETLARSYLEEARSNEHEWSWSGQVGSSETRRNAFAYGRLNSIERILGKDVLDKVLAPVEEKWQKVFEDLMATPVKCMECGEEFLREVEGQVTCLDCPSPFG